MDLEHCEHCLARFGDEVLPGVYVALPMMYYMPSGAKMHRLACLCRSCLAKHKAKKQYWKFYAKIYDTLNPPPPPKPYHEVVEAVMKDNPWMTKEQAEDLIARFRGEAKEPDGRAKR